MWDDTTLRKVHVKLLLNQIRRTERTEGTERTERTEYIILSEKMIKDEIIKTDKENKEIKRERKLAGRHWTSKKSEEMS